MTITLKNFLGREGGTLIHLNLCSGYMLTSPSETEPASSWPNFTEQLLCLDLGRHELVFIHPYRAPMID